MRAQSGAEVIVAWEAVSDWQPKAHPEQVLELVRSTNPEGIAVRSDTKITAEVMAAAPALKVIGRAGVGVDNIDIPAATERGIIVMNTPGGNTIATAELTFTHLLCCSRPVCRADREMKAGGFPRKTLPKGSELLNKTLGICGLGRIGAEVAKRAQAFGMEVLAYDPYLTPQRAESLGVQHCDLEALLKQSDYITVHMPLTSDTRHMIDEAALERCKAGVRIVNVARGGIIDEAALLKGLESGKVAYASLDVFEAEPLAADSPLRTPENLNLTPHLGASTIEAQENVGYEIAVNLVEVLSGGRVNNAINAPSVDPKDLEQLRPYLSLGETLGAFVQQLGLSNQGVQTLDIAYYGKLVDMNTTPLSRAIQKGYLRTISPNVNDVNAAHKLAQLGIKVSIVKSNESAEYTELIQVKLTGTQGKTRTVGGTLYGRGQQPRIVEIDGHSVEVNTRGHLLVLKNDDVPGIVGFIGTALAKDKVNIANLSLSRDKGEGFAVSVYEIDSIPSEATAKAIAAFPGIQKFKVISL